MLRHSLAQAKSSRARLGRAPRWPFWLATARHVGLFEYIIPADYLTIITPLLPELEERSVLVAGALPQIKQVGRFTAHLFSEPTSLRQIYLPLCTTIFPPPMA